LKTKPKQIRMQFRKQLRITIIQMIIRWVYGSSI